MRLMLAGRSDAKKYQNLHDKTSTHLIKVLEAHTHRSQRKVNQWLVNALAPLRAGNYALDSQLIDLEARISAYESDLGPTGRVRKANTVRLNALRQQRLDALSQRAANIARGHALVDVAAESLDTWIRYFEAQAAIYVRARALKDKQEPPASKAAVPTIESIDLADTSDFDLKVSAASLSAKTDKTK